MEEQKVLYINLDSRPDRKTHILNELSKIGVSDPLRFAALQMKNGAIGCTMSHIKCLEMAKQEKWEHVMICEDDAVFSDPHTLLQCMRHFRENMKHEKWDVLLIGANNVPPYVKICDHYIRVSNAQTTTCYIVNSHYYDTLISNFREGVLCLMKEPYNKKKYALDIHWKSLQKIHQWFLLIPLTVYQKEDYSNIEERHVDYKSLMLDLDKPWLFKKREWMA
jgi:glycosyl transferase family 25